MADVLSNIRSVLHQADDVDWREGLNAYRSYNQTMRGLAEFYGYSLETVAAVFAATSPNNDYIKNLRSTVTLLKGYREGIPLKRLTVSTYRAAAVRAWRVLEGEEFLAFTKGKKTRNFYVSIVNPDDPEAVTIDGHMVSIWHGRRFRMKEAAVSHFNYDLLAFDYRRAAFAEFVLPSQLQAILWFAWKRVNQIVYDGQLDLFKPPDDLWNMRPAPEDVKPYYI